MKGFICWSGDYAEKIAKKLKKATDQLKSFSFNNSALDMFLSSMDIEAGKRWRDEINKALTNAEVGIVIVTQDVINSDWVAHEAGALSAQCKRLIVLMANAPQIILHEPLKEYQHMMLSDENLKILLCQLAKGAGLGEPSETLLNSLYEDMHEIRQEMEKHFVTGEDIRWRNKFERPFAISRQEQSPYDLEEILKVVQHRLVLVAQNHYYMTQNELKFWPLIENLLNREVDIDIVAMYPEAEKHTFYSRKEGEKYKSEQAPNVSKSWACYMNANIFLDHVEKTWRAFYEWDKQYDKLCKDKIGNLKFWSAYFTPVTMSFVDPEGDSGFLVLSPRIGYSANSSRPQFILKKNVCSTSFNYYWTDVNSNLSNTDIWQPLTSENIKTDRLFWAKWKSVEDKA